jgi:hypothetical protein
MPDLSSFPPPTPPVAGAPAPGDTSPVAATPYVYPASREPKRLSGGAVALIVTGSVLAVLLIVGGLVVALALAASTVSETLDESAPGWRGDLPLVSGEPGASTPLAPVDCPDPCFSEVSVAKTLASSANLKALGTPDTTEEWGTYSTSNPATDWRYATEQWLDYKLGPDRCFFEILGSPVVSSYTTRPKNTTDTIHFIGSFANSSETTTVSQSLRLFQTSELAEEHMESLAGAISGCSSFKDDAGSTSFVSAAPAISVPDSVAAVGWREDSEDWNRYYVFDVQRGNMVLRTMIWSSGDVTERDFRKFIEATATQLSEIEPTSGDASQD